MPAGIENGQRIRISGAGDAGSSGGPAGDLYVQVQIADDERFHREGSDLVTVLEVTATTAMLGATLPVETRHRRDARSSSRRGSSTATRSGSAARACRRSATRAAEATSTSRSRSSRRSTSTTSSASSPSASIPPSAPQNAPGSARPGVFERVRRAFR